MKDQTVIADGATILIGCFFLLFFFYFRVVPHVLGDQLYSYHLIRSGCNVHGLNQLHVVKRRLSQVLALPLVVDLIQNI